MKGFIDEPVRWCTLSKAEFDKCETLASELKYYVTSLADTHKSLECIQRANHEECMFMLDQSKADIVSLDANELFIGGRHHSLVPIMKEVYPGNEESYYSVAVIQKGGNLSDIGSIAELRDTVACFPSVSSMAGWIIPISTLIEKNVMEIVDCNNHIKSASQFFSGGCAVNILTNKYNPLGDNDQTLCNACGSETQGIRCSTQDPYAGYVGALKCLVSKGQVAFVKHNTVTHAIEAYNEYFPYSPDDFELLCLDGRHAPLSDYMTCNWGEVPSNALSTSSAKTQDEREALQKFLKVISQYFSEKHTANSTSVTTFYLFESFPRYGQGYDLLVSDDAVRLVEVVSTQQNFQVYLPKRVLKNIETVRSCPVEKMVLCVISYPEYAKCLKMKIALEAQLLKPRMDCMMGNSQIGCMVAIQNGEADVSLFEAGDIYTAGLKYDRFTCHPSVMHGGGWVLPMAYLLNNDLIRGYGCNSIRAASEYFQKSCAPGAMSPIYRAFRCLVEGGGNVAFLKHTTVAENTNGKNRMWWARNTLTVDYQLLCRDGTRGDISSYEDCNLGMVRSNAIVTRGGYDKNFTQILAFTNLFLYAQQLFGRDVDDAWNFQLFKSNEPYSDLIFQDATQQLVPLDEEEMHYHPYLGRDFINARYRVDCTASASCPKLSVGLLLLLLVTMNYKKFLRLL
ncbi:Melanotransferrin [Armadillidium nasatum]|uniref:Melanotransferrin n=1 Tax=Armadillidium nasatum TaxID=96803 RepID=A0A5N5T371_9CRUS|nr:Melanotransferrin [Armadillidium nasatum]